MITARLDLAPATLDLCRAESRGPVALGEALGMRVPRSWPPPVFEADDVARVQRQLERSPGERTWTLHYVARRVLRDEGERDLLGIAGYMGPPGRHGEVEIGYAIAEEHQRLGYATEAVEALVAEAFAHPEVRAVAATTYVSLAPSIGVLRKAGFALVADNPETGLLRFERRRAVAEGGTG